MFEPFDTDFAGHSDFFKELRSFQIKDAMMSDEERTSPDTFGCDCVFLEQFVTFEMADDFYAIARDFLKHEFLNLDEFETVTYVDSDPSINWPDRIFERFVLNLMMNAVNHGSVYTKKLFLYLHKVYYRKEYQQLKRFNTLSVGELMSLATDDGGYTSPMVIARILSISRMAGIDIKPDCNFLYLFLNKVHKDCEQDSDSDWDFVDRISDAYKKCHDEVNQLFDNDDEKYDLYMKYERFVGNALRAEGYVEDYVPLCNETDQGIDHRLARTLAVLKKTYKNREFTKEELIMYASIYEAIEALNCTSESIYSRLSAMFYGERSPELYKGFETSFKVEEVDMASARQIDAAKPDNDKKSVPPVGDEQPRYREETLIAEIDSLHRKIHEQEGHIKELRSEISDHRKLAEENRQLRVQIDSDHKELVALREQIYNLTEEDPGGEAVSVDDMKKYLQTKRVIIIGGHSNWQQKLKQEFPDWEYINSSVSGSLDASVVDKADNVYFFTDTVSHSTYFKYMNVVKEHDVKFGYIHGVNIENNIRKIYRELKV